MPSNGKTTSRNRMAHIAKKMRSIETSMNRSSDTLKKNDTDVANQERRMIDSGEKSAKHTARVKKLLKRTVN